MDRCNLSTDPVTEVTDLTFPSEIHFNTTIQNFSGIVSDLRSYTISPITGNRKIDKDIFCIATEIIDLSSKPVVEETEFHTNIKLVSTLPFQVWITRRSISLSGKKN